MNTVKDIYTGPTSRRPHRVVGAVALLITWAFFGTTKQVMDTGAYLEALFILAGTDTALCMYLWARAQTRRITPVASSEKSENANKDMEKAA